MDENVKIQKYTSKAVEGIFLLDGYIFAVLKNLTQAEILLDELQNQGA